MYSGPPSPRPSPLKGEGDLIEKRSLKEKNVSTFFLKGTPHLLGEGGLVEDWEIQMVGEGPRRPIDIALARKGVIDELAIHGRGGRKAGLHFVEMGGLVRDVGVERKSERDT